MYLFYHPMFVILCFPLFLFSLLVISKHLFTKKINKRTAPQAGGSLPLVGHLHLLAGPQPAHITLGNMVDKYGPIFTIKLGVHKALVVSDWEIAKECFTTNDKAFANRPKIVAAEIMAYNNGMLGFAPYGAYWHQMRKSITTELLSSYRLERLKHVQESAVRESLRELHHQWNENNSESNRVLVERSKWFADLTLNLILRIIVGKQISSAGNDVKSGKWRKALKELFEFVGKFLIADAFPFLRWLDIGGVEKAMKKIAKELDQVLEAWLEEHKSQRISGQIKEEDFMDVMLSVLTDEEDHDDDAINEATCLGLILAGSDTTTVTLTWALSLLLNNRDVRKNVQDELDSHVDKDKMVVESDIKNLV